MKNKKLFAILTLVCFMMTLMPVAAFAATDADTSYVYTVKANPTVKLNASNEAYAPITFELADETATAVTSDSVYVWFTEAGKTTPSTAFQGLFTKAGSTYTPATTVDSTTGTYKGTLTSGVEYYAKFVREGEFTVNASLAPVAGDLGDSALFGTDAANKVITVKGDVNNEYTITYNNRARVDGEKFAYVGTPIDADNVAKTTVTMKLSKNDGTATTPVAGANVKGATVSIATNSSNIEVSKEKVTTNALGNFSFDIAGIREGSYEIYVSYGSYEVTLEVTVGSTDPAYITVAKAPTAPIDIDNSANLSNVVRFLITDINGNTVPAGVPQRNAAPTPSTELTSLYANSGSFDGAYAAIVDAPADSDLGDEDVTLVVDTHSSNWATGLYATLAIAGGLDAEGTYKFKVALNNGNAVYVTVEAAEFGKPVGIVLEYSAPSVELGGVLNTKDFLLVDAKGVTTAASTKVELAASGYAIENFNTTDGTITVKADEKYLGSTINVTAVSERYNLMTSASVKVVAEAAGLMFAGKTAEVNVNNAINVVLVDAQGNRTAFGDARNDRTVYDINYVVLDKPEGAKVSVNTAAADNNLLAAGSFKMNLTCDKIGTVKVQAIAKITKTAADGNEVVKYYTGVGEIAVGNGQVGKSVVMSIGSNTMIADGKVATVDAQPMIQNGRTFVPFRALAEAFGATVAYDQATSAVKATLNGVEVVMTVGSPVYTVNGVEKTADVAPFIADSRTFVPVRFAAEAFGITVTPTYNTDGSVADVLFNM